MISKPPRFVCLAAYDCSCRPIGKPVSESTMKRHRAIANNTRSTRGLPPLPKGPIYSPARAAIEYEIRMQNWMKVPQLPEGHASNSISAPGGSSSVMRGESSEQLHGEPGPEFHDMTDEDECNLPSEEDIRPWRSNNTVDVRPSIHAEKDIGNASDGRTSKLGSGIEQSRRNGQFPSNSGTQSSSSYEVCQRSNSVTESSYNSDPSRDSEVESDHSAYINDSLDHPRGYGDRSNSLQEESSGSSSFSSDDPTLAGEVNAEGSGGSEQRVGMRTSAALKFKEWAFRSRDWVSLFVEHGVKGTLVSRILKLIKAPISMITMKRNLRKYSGFDTQFYKVCRPHMLVSEEPSDRHGPDIENEDHSCQVCEKEGNHPIWDWFEYFPILPRIKSWVSKEETYHTLYDYHHSKLDEHFSNEQSETLYSRDFFDGELYKRIVEANGGYEAVRHDLFLAISCDGFQTYENRSYDCWPIIAMVLNLSPHQRFLIQNIAPLGFVKGPHQPSLLDTFFVPLLREILAVNSNGGSLIRMWNGEEKKVRIHLVHISADGPASQLLNGTAGGNGKACCRLCLFQGYYCPISRHYYYPSTVKEQGECSTQTETITKYDIFNPTMRTVLDIRETLRLIEHEPGVTPGHRNELRKSTGIIRSTVLLQIPSIVPYSSFPLDTMHLFMNVTKDLLELYRGENAKLISRGFKNDAFVINSTSWMVIETEMREIHKGTSLEGFGIPPRVCAKYRTWKAAECRDFMSLYAAILFEGHLPPVYLRGLGMFIRVVQIAMQPSLSFSDVDELDQNGKEFVAHFEKMYYLYDPKRVCLCKSTLHALIHLGQVVRICGPLVGCNQMWVERYIGEAKRRLHATFLAAESLCENAKLYESYKMFYGCHFATQAVSHRDQDVIIEEQNGVSVLSPFSKESLSDRYHSRLCTRQLLIDYLRGVEELSSQDAIDAVSHDTVWSFGRMKISCGKNEQVVGALDSRRHRKHMSRSDQYVAAEFCSASSPNERTVYYGRIRKILRYEFRTSTWTSSRTLVLIDWAYQLHRNSLGQVFQKTPKKFTRQSVESADVILNSIGVLEHKIPSERCRRTYFIDPHREVNCLLHAGRSGADGVSRDLKGFR